MKRLIFSSIVFLCLTFVSTGVNAQNLSMFNVSQKSSITQRLGLSDVTIEYHSPGVKGRKVFGGIIAYDNIWRAGANENTTITFTHNAMVEGITIAAGTYGLYMVPGETESTILFSKYFKSWGTVVPDEKDLVLQVSVKTGETPFKEWLNYNFTERGNDHLIAAMQWEKTSILFKIEFNIHSIALENARAELKGVAGFSWRGYFQAANYCLINNINLEEAMAWVDH